MMSIRKGLLGLVLSLLVWPAWGAEINSLSTTDASNVARFPEGMAASAVNDGARALEGLLARWHKDTNCSVDTTGSSNAYVLSANQTLTAYYDGLLLCFTANFTNTGAATINVDSLGAKTLKKAHDQDVASGDLESGGQYLVVYDGTNFQILSEIAATNQAFTNVDNQFSNDQSLVSTNAGASEAPGLDLYRNSASPAVNDNIGTVRFKGEDSGSNQTTYGKISVFIDDPTDGSEDSHIRFDNQVAGAATAGFSVGTSIYANGNTDPGTGKIDADDLLISGVSVTPGWTQDGATTLSTGSPTAITILSGLTAITVDEIEIGIDGGSTNTANQAIMIQLADDGGTETTGYDGKAQSDAGGATTESTNSSGFLLAAESTQDGATTWTGTVVLRHWGGNVWSYTSSGGLSTTNFWTKGSGFITLDDSLNSVIITTSGGSATFDAGTGYARTR